MLADVLLMVWLCHWVRCSSWSKLLLNRVPAGHPSLLMYQASWQRFKTLKVTDPDFFLLTFIFLLKYIYKAWGSVIAFVSGCNIIYFLAQKKLNSFKLFCCLVNHISEIQYSTSFIVIAYISFSTTCPHTTAVKLQQQYQHVI